MEINKLDINVKVCNWEYFSKIIASVFLPLALSAFISGIEFI